MSCGTGLGLEREVLVRRMRSLGALETGDWRFDESFGGGGFGVDDVNLRLV